MVCPFYVPLHWLLPFCYMFKRKKRSKQIIMWTRHIFCFNYHSQNFFWLIGNDKDGDKVITNHVCQHGGKNWPYWFRKMGTNIFFIFITDSRVQYLQMFNNILLVVTEISIMITCSCREYYTFRSSYSPTSSVVGWHFSWFFNQESSLSPNQVHCNRWSGSLSSFLFSNLKYSKINWLTFEPRS